MTKDKDVFAKCARLEAENKALQREVDVLKKGCDHFSAKCERMRREAVEREVELITLRKVADAAVAWDIAMNAFERLDALKWVVPDEDVRAAVDLMKGAKQATGDAFDEALMEYRKLKEGSG